MQLRQALDCSCKTWRPPRQAWGIDRALCYGPDDFRLGSFVNVYGRSLYLHDCDEFTRTWYKVRWPRAVTSCAVPSWHHVRVKFV